MKKILLNIVLIILIFLAFYFYKQQFYKTKFNVEYYDKSYDIALITSSYDALKQNINSYKFNELYFLTDGQTYNKRIADDTWPTSNNLAIVNNQIIYKNFSEVVNYDDYVTSDVELLSSDIYFANYLDRYITSNNEVIFNEINSLQKHNPVNNKLTTYPVNEYTYQVIGYDAKKQEIKAIYMNDQYYFSNISEKSETSQPLKELLPGFSDSLEIVGGLDNGNKLVTYEYVDFNEVDYLYPFQIWDLRTGKQEREIELNVSNNLIGADMFPEAAICGDNCIMSLTRNGYIYMIDTNSLETVEYNISHLKLNKDDTTYLQYVEEDDIIYLITQPLNEDKFLEIYDVTNDKLVLQVEINRFDQFYSGFTVNKKSID